MFVIFLFNFPTIPIGLILTLPSIHNSHFRSFSSYYNSTSHCRRRRRHHTTPHVLPLLPPPNIFTIYRMKEEEEGEEEVDGWIDGWMDG